MASPSSSVPGESMDTETAEWATSVTEFKSLLQDAAESFALPPHVLNDLVLDDIHIGG